MMTEKKQKKMSGMQETYQESNSLLRQKEEKRDSHSLKYVCSNAFFY